MHMYIYTSTYANTYIHTSGVDNDLEIDIDDFEAVLDELVIATGRYYEENDEVGLTDDDSDSDSDDDSDSSNSSSSGSRIDKSGDTINN